MLKPEHLISSPSSYTAISIAGDDNTFSVYIHPYAGYFDVALGTPDQQTILTSRPSSRLLEHAVQQFAAISSRINITFELISSYSEADISFFVDTEINLGNPRETVLGVVMTYSNYSNGRQWNEIFLNGPLLSSSNSTLEPYVFNHELLHALGLEHPFDDFDGDFYLSTDPQQSARPDETVMSYIVPENSIYPSDLSSADYLALEHIWGPAPLSPSSPAKPISVYRLYDPLTGRHLYSSNHGEIDQLTSSDSVHSFVNEGIAYTVGPNADLSLFRFYNINSQSHVYTANPSERDLIISDYSHSHLYEGIAYNVYSSDIFADVDPVYRFYNPHSDSHFYTANEFERSSLNQVFPHWIDEGIAWYV